MQTVAEKREPGTSTMLELSILNTLLRTLPRRETQRYKATKHRARNNKHN